MIIYRINIEVKCMSFYNCKMILYVVVKLGFRHKKKYQSDLKDT